MPKGRRRWKIIVSAQAVRQRESESSHPLPFGSIQALKGLDDVHPHGGEQSTLLILQIQMLISSGNTLTHMLRNNV